jgi:hypothetical protein
MGLISENVTISGFVVSCDMPSCSELATGAMDPGTAEYNAISTGWGQYQYLTLNDGMTVKKWVGPQHLASVNALFT